MSPMRRFAFLATLFMLCVLVSGCWDMVEISRSSLVTSLALEPGKSGNFRITMEVLNSSEASSKQGGKGNAPTQLFTVEADTIAEAIGRINEQYNRMLIGSHGRVIIIDERLARGGLEPFIDFAQRSRFIRENITVLISNKTKASDLLNIAYPSGNYAGLGIESQIDNYYRNWGGVPDSHLYEIAMTSTSIGKELMLGAVTAIGDNAETGNMDSVKSMRKKAIVQVTGAAVFRGDKLIGFLPRKDTNTVLLVTNRLKRTTYSVPLREPNRYAAVRFIHLHASNRVRMVQGRPKITVEIEGTGFIASLDGQVPIDRATGFRELEQRTADYLKKRVTSTIESVQRNYRSDIFGFGESMYRHDFREFISLSDRWNEQFARADVEVQVRVKLERSELKSKKIDMS